MNHNLRKAAWMTVPAILALALIGCQQGTPTEPLAFAEPTSPAEMERLAPTPVPDMVEFAGWVLRVDLERNSFAIVSVASDRPSVIKVGNRTQWDPTGCTNLEEVAKLLANGKRLFAEGAGQRTRFGRTILALKLSVKEKLR